MQLKQCVSGRQTQCVRAELLQMKMWWGKVGEVIRCSHSAGGFMCGVQVAVCRVGPLRWSVHFRWKCRQQEVFQSRWQSAEAICPSRECPIYGLLVFGRTEMLSHLSTIIGKSHAAITETTGKTRPVPSSSVKEAS